jgi:hypothetical protein
MRQSAELLDPLYVRLKQFVLSLKVVGTDDTPVKVLDRSLVADAEAAKVAAAKALAACVPSAVAAPKPAIKTKGKPKSPNVPTK